MSNPIFIIGYMAAGKTTLGRYAAREMGRDFIDLDRYIEARYRKSIADIFASDGEARFREIERNMLHEVAEFDNVLVATGGGTPCFFDNMEYMNGRGVVVFLSCPVETICRRIRVSKVKRPLLLSLDDETLASRVNEMLMARLPFYKQATYTFDSSQYESRSALVAATKALQSLIGGSDK